MEECDGVVFTGRGDAEGSTRFEVDSIHRLALSHNISDRCPRLSVEHVTKPESRKGGKDFFLYRTQHRSLRR